MPFDNPQPPNRHAALLRDTKYLIRSPALWTKALYVNGHQMCLVQALRFASQHCDLHDDARYLLRLLSKELPLPWRWTPMTAPMKLIAYNDWRSTKHSDIIGLIDRAITRVEVKEPCHV